MAGEETSCLSYLSEVDILARMPRFESQGVEVNSVNLPMCRKLQWLLSSENHNWPSSCQHMVEMSFGANLELD